MTYPQKKLSIADKGQVSILAHVPWVQGAFGIVLLAILVLIVLAGGSDCTVVTIIVTRKTVFIII